MVNEKIACRIHFWRSRKHKFILDFKSDQTSLSDHPSRAIIHHLILVYKKIPLLSLLNWYNQCNKKINIYKISKTILDKCSENLNISRSGSAYRQGIFDHDR